MDPSMEDRISETVLEILRNSDLQEMTEFKVRKQASENLGIDLSEPNRKKFVRKVVEDFLREQMQAQNDVAEEAGEEEQKEVEEQEEEEERNEDGKEYDDEGDLILCKLSDKRRVTLQDFRGRTLVSIREYYQKDGKYLPTSKGISLTAEQWATFKKNVPAIEKAIQKAIEKLEGR